MKISTILKQGLLGLAIIPALCLFAGGRASADTINAPATPAFNIYSDLKYDGNEADFVKLRPSTGNPTDAGEHGVRNALYTDSLVAGCTVGEMFDVRTYVHNGANEDFNNNGAGSAVAHNVNVSMTAPLNTENTRFTFGSTVTASNAATVTDTGKLNCSNKVKLEIVPGTVKVYSRTLGWTNATIDAVNGTIKIGSRVAGSGDVWGCFDERVMIVYTVKVVAIPTPPTPIYSCDLLTNTGKISDNKYGFKVDYTAKNGATFKDVTYVYSDGTTVTDGATTTHLFTNNDAKKTVKATVNFNVTGVTGVKSHTSAKCATEFTKTVVTPPAVLPATGAGSTIAIFGATSLIGAFLYRMRALRNQA